MNPEQAPLPDKNKINPEPSKVNPVIHSPEATRLLNGDQSVNIQQDHKDTLHKRSLIIGMVIMLVLIVLISASLGKTKNLGLRKAQSSNSGTSQNNSHSSTTPSNNTSQGQSSSSSSQSTTDTNYFDNLSADLNQVNKLAGAMNQACETNFPPPAPCASDIQAYRKELLSAQSNLNQSSPPPTIFKQAESTLMEAITTDLDATNEALSALQAKNLSEWLNALNLHGQAGQELGTAGTQAKAAL